MSQAGIPYSLLAAAVKYAGYRVGYLEPHLPRALKRRLSQQPSFWENLRHETLVAPRGHLE